jgi:hypothetical protein
VPLCGIIGVRPNSHECESMFVVPLKISWEFRRKCASKVFAILLMVFNYVSNHTESVRRLQTKNELLLITFEWVPPTTSCRGGVYPRPENSNTQEMNSKRFGIDLAEMKWVNRQTAPVKSGKT